MILSVRIQEMIDRAYKEAYDEAYKKAYKETSAAIVIKRMLDRGRTIQEIAEDIGLSEDEVRKLVDKQL